LSFTTAEYDRVYALAGSLCGITWDHTKAYLVDSRLTGLPSKFGCATLYDYLKLVAKGDPKAKVTFVEAVTTRETSFFRDQSPFEALEHKVLPELIDAKVGSIFPRRLRIWSAACSTGQEPYSIAMTIAGLLPDFLDWDISIYATDVCDAAIATASAGSYSDFEMERGITPRQRESFFDRHTTGWKIKDELRSLIRFETRNLMKPFDGLAYFDIIFCRNVAIYFSPDVRDDLFRRISNLLSKEGTLFVGHAERLDHLGPGFTTQTHCRSVYYQPHRQRETVRV
jgi:chemotaxis protein methyltransferase CheR